MSEDVLQALYALTAFFVPMGFAWFVLSRTARRHPHEDRHGEAPPPHKHRPPPPMR